MHHGPLKWGSASDYSLAAIVVMLPPGVIQTSLAFMATTAGLPDAISARSSGSD